MRTTTPGSERRVQGHLHSELSAEFLIIQRTFSSPGNIYNILQNSLLQFTLQRGSDDIRLTSSGGIPLTCNLDLLINYGICYLQISQLKQIL